MDGRIHGADADVDSVDACDPTYGAESAVGEWLADIAPSAVMPLWGGRLHLGKLTVLDGDPGVGKTLVAIDIAARVTSGRDMPDGSPGPGRPAAVVYFSAEDDPAGTLLPRLEAAGGDPRRLLAVTAVRVRRPKGGWGRRLPTFADLDLIASALVRSRARLAIFDPFMAYLGPGSGAFRDPDVRRALAPVADLAAQAEAAFLLIRHLNKSNTGPALYRGGGSIGIIAAARSGLLIARDPQQPERLVVASTKNNLGPTPPSVTLRVVSDARGVPVVRWESECELRAGELLAAPSTEPDQTALGEACRFLVGALAARPLPEEVIAARARGRGLTMRTVRRAKRLLGVRSERRGFGADGEWLWALPSDPSALIPAQSSAEAGT